MSGYIQLRRNLAAANRAPRWPYSVDFNSPQMIGLTDWWVFDAQAGKARNMLPGGESISENAIDANDWGHGVDGRPGVNLDSAAKEYFNFDVVQGFGTSFGASGSRKFSMFFNLHTDVTNARQIIFADWNAAGAGSSVSISLEILSSGKLFGSINSPPGFNNALVTGNSVTAGERFWGGITYDVSDLTMELFQKGLSVGTSTLGAGSDMNDGTDRRFGRAGAFDSIYFDGMFYEARIYNYRVPARIIEQFDDSLILQPGRVLYYIPAAAPSSSPWFFQNQIIRHRRAA